MTDGGEISPGPWWPIIPSSSSSWRLRVLWDAPISLQLSSLMGFFTWNQPKEAQIRKGGWIGINSLLNTGKRTGLCTATHCLHLLHLCYLWVWVCECSGESISVLGELCKCKGDLWGFVRFCCGLEGLVKARVKVKESLPNKGSSGNLCFRANPTIT